MTVVIAAAGDLGEASARALADRDVCRVETHAGAREALGDATVVVVGDLAEGAPADVRDAARDAGVPVVALGERGEGYDATATPDDVGAVRNAVELAERAAGYRAAVDELYERSRTYAGEGPGADDPGLRDARERAYRRLRDLRETAGRVPYEDLFDPDYGTDEGSGDGNDGGLEGTDGDGTGSDDGGGDAGGGGAPDR